MWGPRLRFTVGGLMVAVLVAGLLIWLTRDFLLYPNIGEQKARASCHQAMLVREVAEYALWEYITSNDLQEKTTDHSQIQTGESDRARAIDRMEWQEFFDRVQARMQSEIPLKYANSRQIKLLRSDIERARADERSKLAIYRMEQARRSLRWRILGF